MFVAEPGANDRRLSRHSCSDPARARNRRLQAFPPWLPAMRRLHPAPETVWDRITARFFTVAQCLGVRLRVVTAAPAGRRPARSRPARPTREQGLGTGSASARSSTSATECGLRRVPPRERSGGARHGPASRGQGPRRITVRVQCILAGMVVLVQRDSTTAAATGWQSSADEVRNDPTASAAVAAASYSAARRASSRARLG